MIAIGEGAGLMDRIHAISLVRVSITFIRFAGGLAALTAPATTYLPSGVILRSPSTNAFNICQSGSFLDANCWPPP